MNYTRVIFICNYKAQYGGNFLASFNGLSKLLLNKGVSVYFVFPKEAQNIKWEIDLSNYHLIYSDFDDKSLLFTTEKYLDRHGITIVHLNFLSSLLLIKMKKKLSGQVAYIFQQHMAVNFGLKQIIKGIILRLFAPKHVAYVGVSPAVYHSIKKEVGIRRSYMVMNSIDVSRLKTTNVFRNNNILIFGTDFKRKGVDLAISAIKKSKIKTKCNLLIVTHNKKQAFEFIYSQFGSIPSFVKIISPVQNIKELYSKCFLFLSPSRLEAFGYSVVEATYSGNQVIISNVPGQNELSKIPGIQMVESENVSQLRFKIINAFKHKTEDRSQINKKAIRYINQHYSLKAWTHQMLKIYDHL